MEHTLSEKVVFIRGTRVATCESICQFSLNDDGLLDRHFDQEFIWELAVHQGLIIGKQKGHSEEIERVWKKWQYCPITPASDCHPNGKVRKGPEPASIYWGEQV